MSKHNHNTYFQLQPCFGFYRNKHNLGGRDHESNNGIVAVAIFAKNEWTAKTISSHSACLCNPIKSSLY